MKRLLVVASLASLLTASAVPCTALMLKRIDVVGVTAFPRGEVDNLVAPYLDREVEVEELVALANTITQRYVESGYLGSGASYRPQDLGDGVLEITVTEGRLAGVVIEEIGRLSPAFVEGMIRNELSDPLNITHLQRAFSMLEFQPTIDSVRGRLVPGAQPGETTLKLAVTEADAFSVSLAANNYRSPSVGSGQFEANLRHLNLTGHGDVLRLGIGETDGVDSFSLSYSFPVPALRTRFAAYHSSGDSLVVEEPFDQIDINSESDTTGLRATTYFVQSLSRTFSFDLGIEEKESRTTLFGQPFDFSPGSVDGTSRAAVVSAGLQYEYRAMRWAVSSRLTWRKGVDARNATLLPGELPDGEFDLWRLQVSYVQRFGDDADADAWVWRTRFNSQFSDDILQAFERFPLGGHDSVRGYRENQLLRDEAWELRTQLDLPFALGSRTTLVVFPFLDAGEGRNARFIPNVEPGVSLASAGLGVSLRYRGFTLQAEWAARFREKQKQSDDLQDEGLHLGVSYEF